jgi:hypothetical protein
MAQCLDLLLRCLRGAPRAVLTMPPESVWDLQSAISAEDWPRVARLMSDFWVAYDRYKPEDRAHLDVLAASVRGVSVARLPSAATSIPR